MKKKSIASVSAIIILAATCIGYFMLNTPSEVQRNLQNEKVIAISAKAIVKEFQNNEATANTKYLNKVVEISGDVTDVNTDKTGNFTITLKSDDSLSHVFFTLKPGNEQPKTGTTITIKGICTGFLIDVVINEAIIVK